MSGQINKWEHVWVIGGGPSAATLDVDRLRGGIVVGVNDAAFYKSCNAFFTIDHTYTLDNRDKILDFPGEIYVATRAKRLPWFDKWPINLWRTTASYYPIMVDKIISTGPSNSPGCSGHAVLNLLAQRGAKTIVLFGYDFDNNNYRYFFDDNVVERVDIPGVLTNFDCVAPWYKKHGVSILNANPNSMLKAFPRITQEEAYRLVGP